MRSEICGLRREWVTEGIDWVCGWESDGVRESSFSRI